MKTQLRTGTLLLPLIKRNDRLRALTVRHKHAVNTAAKPPLPGGSKKEKRFTFYKAVLIYALGGLVGTVWETLLNLIRGRGFVFCNGSILTPFNFVYGTGAVVIILLLRNKQKWWQIFIIGSLGGGAVEYALSYLEEAVLGTRSWDYSHKFLNINGRTTIPYMLFWGLLCLAVILVIYRPLDSALEALPEKALKVLAVVLACWIAADWIVTVSALLRYAARAEGTAALTVLGEWIDKVFDDAFMKKRFPSMRF
mgnify:FL=1